MIDFFLSFWANDRLSLNKYEYLYILMGLFIGLIICGFIVAIFHGLFAKRAGYNTFRYLFELIFKKKVTFFDITPIGQILNLCSKDTDESDYFFPGFGINAVINLAKYLSILILIIINNFVIIPLIVLYVITVLKLYTPFLRTSMELRRLEQLAYSPIISNLNELYNGIILLRGFNKLKQTKQKFIGFLNHLVTIFYHDMMVNILLATLLEFLNTLLLLIVLFLFLLAKIYDWRFFVRDQNFVALTLNYVFFLAVLVNFMIFVFSESMKSFSSVQRIFKNIDQKMLERSFDTPIPPSDWPKNGSIKARGLTLRYRQNLPLVLKNINFDIKDKEKIGIVGRTGSGKSTMILALTRLVELDRENDTNGYIEINNIKTYSIGLGFLRKNIRVIPQEPFLMKGTVRENIDPFDQYSDDQIEEVLKKALLWDSYLFEVKNDEGDVTFLNDQDKLNFAIEDRGSNLSLGQKQLICIARALIDTPRILLMDEATSNIDPVSDQKIQEIIKTEFKNSTIITIAHRLNTIIEYDRIFVMKNGELVEEGIPYKLLTSNSLFKELVKSNGKLFEDQMIELARRKFDKTINQD